MSDTGVGENDQHTGRASPARFVLVTDQLPVGSHAVVGLAGLADDPVTRALLRATRRRAGAWVGRRPAGGSDRGAAGLATSGASQGGSRPGTQREPPEPVDPREPLPCLDTPELPVRVVGVEIDDPDELDGYDAGHARQTIWPLYHDLARPPAFDNQWRTAYRRVNERFAATVANQAAHGATVWVHDYHLQLVPAMLRRLRPDLRVGYFLHTPFPPADLFTRLPMYQEILVGLLGAHVIGFPTDQGAENFFRLASDLLGRRPAGLTDGPPPQVAVFAPAVDTRAIERLAASPDVIDRASSLRAELADNRAIVLSLDRADEAMGTDRRLRAIADLFASGRLPADDVTLIQVVVEASAEEPPDPGLRGRIEREVARINGDFARLGHPCVHYVLASPSLAERVALYRAADVFMATPLREATSLPALEYVATRIDTGGAMVLSEFSGTATALPDAYLVNPYDDDQIRAGLMTALDAGFEEHGRRMKQMREYVCAYDASAWAESFLHALQTATAGHSSS